MLREIKFCLLVGFFPLDISLVHHSAFWLQSARLGMLGLSLLLCYMGASSFPSVFSLVGFLKISFAKRCPPAAA